MAVFYPHRIDVNMSESLDGTRYVGSSKANRSTDVPKQHLDITTTTTENIPSQECFNKENN